MKHDHHIKSKYKLFFDKASDAIISIDSHGIILEFNKSAEFMFGYTADEIVGQPVEILIPSPHKERHIEYLREYRKKLELEGQNSDEIRHHESTRGIKAIKKDGTLVPMEMSVFAIDLDKYTAIIRDSTRHIAEQIEKDQFLANMSHEIRTPLNGIIGMTSLMEKTVLNEEQMDYLDIIKQSGYALLSIINDILDITKLEAHKVVLSAKPMSIAKCLESSYGVLVLKAQEKNIEIVYYIDKKVPEYILGDFYRVQQVLVNLLSNAIKFTNSGKIIINVTCQETDPIEKPKNKEHSPKNSTGSLSNSNSNDESRRSSLNANSYSGDDLQEILTSSNSELHGTNGQWFEVKFTIEDTGIGIHEQDKTKLFRIFSQLDQSSTKQYQGTGLGLAICAQLCNLMNGKVWLEKSQPDIGSTFAFTIKAQEFKRNSIHDGIKHLQDKRVLVVDDNEVNRTFLFETLSDWGMIPITCSSGYEAQKSYIKHGFHFDLALIDIHMPKMDGVTLAKKIREAKLTYPLIALSSIGEKIQDMEVFDSFITKPVRTNQLLKRIINIFTSIKTHSDEDVPHLTKSIKAIENRNNKVSILIAEDIITNQKVIIDMLRKLGYTDVTTVDNGLMAMEYIEKDPDRYNIILLDLKMPKKSGLEVAKETNELYKKLGKEKPVIIAQTAVAMYGDRDFYLKEGHMDDYITKPIDFDELSEVLSRYDN